MKRPENKPPVLSLIRWFDLALLSLISTASLFLIGPSISKLFNYLIPILTADSELLQFLLFFFISFILWAILIQLGAFRISDLYSFNTIKYPPTWLAIIILFPTYYYFYQLFFVDKLIINTDLDFPLLFFALISGSIAIILCKTISDSQYPGKPLRETIHIPIETIDLYSNPIKIFDWIQIEEPIRNPNQDLFNLSVFSRRIVSNILNSPLKTIALVGPYGCGKSSVLELVRYNIENYHNITNNFEKFPQDDLIDPNKIISACPITANHLN